LLVNVCRSGGQVACLISQNARVRLGGHCSLAVRLIVMTWWARFQSEIAIKTVSNIRSHFTRYCLQKRWSSRVFDLTKRKGETWRTLFAGCKTDCDDMVGTTSKRNCNQISFKHSFSLYSLLFAEAVVKSRV